MTDRASRILIALVAALACVATASAQKRTITETDLLKFVWIADPQISPDGSRVAFIRVDVNDKADGYDTSIWIVGTDGKDQARRLTGGTRDNSPRWSPDGRRLAFVRADLDVFKQVKNEHGGTVNDVILSIVAGGIGRYLRARGHDTTGLELRAMVPVSVRANRGVGIDAACGQLRTTAGRVGRRVLPMAEGPGADPGVTR